jgi:hypothetical protein
MTVRRKIRLGEIPAVQIGGRGSAIRIPTRALISTAAAQPHQPD